MADQPFADRLLAWFERHGRHDLPWQQPRSPYRTVVSELMLQQTQVATVRRFFDPFVERFASFDALAAAPLGEVLAQWSGFGYYRRAGHLHQLAKRVVDEYEGQLPRTQEALEHLPGLGRSTAAAVLSQAFDVPAAILDGNVRRVLARHAGITGWPGDSQPQRALWREAELRVPANRGADYTQAQMDLGALICTRRNPQCDSCPVAQDCYARRSGRVSDFPAARPGRERPIRKCAMLFAIDRQKRVLLEQRGPAGIWPNLLSLPEGDSVDHALRSLPETLQRGAGPARVHSRIRHDFTHFRLEATLYQLELDTPQPTALGETSRYTFILPTEALHLALPAPIRRFLLQVDRDADEAAQRLVTDTRKARSLG